MTIAAKQNLSADVEEKIGNYLTVVQTRNVVADLNETLEHYDVEDIKNGEVSFDYLDMYLNAKMVEGKSMDTLALYRTSVERLLVSVGKPTQKITTEDIRTYLAEEKARGLSDNTIKSKRANISAFFTWLWKEGVIKTNPITNIAPIKIPKKIVDSLDEVEMERLKSACANKTELAVVMFLWKTGARVSEACGVDIKDVDWENMSVTVYGKGKKEREVYFNSYTAVCLKEYLAERTDKDPCLFYGRRGRLTVRGIQKMLQRIGNRAGVEKVHPHRMRHTCATEMDAKGLSMVTIQTILGHEDITTTALYISANRDSVRQAYRAVM